MMILHRLSYSRIFQLYELISQLTDTSFVLFYIEITINAGKTLLRDHHFDRCGIGCFRRQQLSQRETVH